VLGIHVGERGSPESCNVELGKAYSALPRRVTLVEKTHEKSAAILLPDGAPVNRIHGVLEPTHIVLVVIRPNQTEKEATPVFSTYLCRKPLKLPTSKAELSRLAEGFDGFRL
jgi:hypothetical protein